MKKYFITSSVNIDNILSTESISPLSCYAERTFGYNNFNCVKKSTPRDCIVLFDKIPSVHLDNSQVEQYPVVIELNDELFPQIFSLGSHKECELFAYTQTIHISPQDCKFLFFTPQAMRCVQVGLSDSKLNKWGNYFDYVISAPSTVDLEEILSNVEIPIFKETAKCDDNKYNAIKGFLYGFYMGMTKTISPTLAKMQTIQKRVYDIAAATRSNNGILNSLLETELRQLDIEYESLDPTKQEIQKQWNQQLEEFGLNETDVVKWLQCLGIEKNAKQSFCSKNNFVICPKLSANRYSTAVELYAKELKAHIEHLISLERSRIKDTFALSQYVTVNEDVTMVSLQGEDENTSLFNKIMEKIFSQHLFDLDYLRINRLEVATEITKKVKEIYLELGKQWEDSSEQNYFFELRQNISNGDSFDVNSIDHVVLKSLVAFVLKGDDIVDLNTYLTLNAFSEYKYAWSFWGYVQGYVKISKGTLENTLSQPECENLYKQVYHILNKKEYSGDLHFKEFAPISYPTSSIPTSQISNSSKSNWEPIKSAQTLETNTTKNPALYEWKKTLINILQTLDIKDKAKCQGHLMEVLMNINHIMKNEEFIKCLSKDPNWKTRSGDSSAALKKYKAALKAHSNKLIAQETKATQGLFDFAQDNKSLYFYADDGAWNIIKGHIPNFVQEDIYTDLDWFQREFRKPAKSRWKAYQKIDENNNKIVIEKFCSLKSGPDKFGRIQAPYFTEDLREKLRSILLQYYNA